jgi:hypothetical protein
MKFLTYCALIAATAAVQRHHNHHPHSVEFVATLPDVRADTVSDEDIAAHEAARSEAAKIKKNPQAELLATVRADLDQISKDLSFGVSYSQAKRNDHARALCTKVGTAILGYADGITTQVESKTNESMTELNAHNISAMIFYDVQL